MLISKPARTAGNETHYRCWLFLYMAFNIEVNWEALQALTLADLIALRNYSHNQSVDKNDQWFAIKKNCISEIERRLSNIFIF